MKNVYKTFCAIAVMLVITGTVVSARGKNEKAYAGTGNNKQRIEFANKLNGYIEKKAWAEALKLFDSLSDEEKKDISLQNLKIAVLVSQGDIAEAEKIAKELEKEQPKNVDVLYTLSMIGQAKNDDKMHSAYLRKMLAVDKDNPQALYEQGIDLYSKGKYKNAQEIFMRILKKHPNHADALIWSGKVFYLQKKLPDAEACYMKVLKQEPDNSLAIAELARVYSETERMKEAIAEVKKAIDLSPDTAHYWNDLGSYNLQTGRKQAALDAFTEAVKLVPDSHLVHIYLAGLHDDFKNTDAAIKHYKEVTRLYPQYYFAYESLGVLLFEKHDWAGSYNAFINALSYAPKNTRYALTAAVCSYKMGEKKTAKAFLQKYVKTVDKKKKEIDYYFCRLFTDFAGESDANLRVQKIKTESEKLQWLYYLGAFYSLSGKKELAAKYYRESTATEYPNFYEYRMALAELK